MMVKGDADLPVGRMSPTVSYVWALVPLFTLGMGTVFVLGWAAHRLRSRELAGGTAVALIATIAAFAVSSIESPVGGFLFIGLIGGGLAVTFTVRRRLVDPGYSSPSGPPARAPAPRNAAQWADPRTTDPAVGAALGRRQRRLEARRLLESDPALARELRIGRPDLPRKYDDGGLVDVNHVPAAVFADLPGFTPELAQHVARIRDEHHGFAFLEEMDVYAGLPEGLASELAERLVFLR